MGELLTREVRKDGVKGERVGSSARGKVEGGRVAYVAHVGDSSHHGARLCYTVVEELHEPTATVGAIVGPVVDESSAEPVWVGKLGHDAF
jgi:hypothetical protein